MTGERETWKKRGEEHGGGRAQRRRTQLRKKGVLRGGLGVQPVHKRKGRK